MQQENRSHFKFELVHTDRNCGARAGIITTPRGVIETPIFMPVGTHGAIKALQPQVLEEMKIPIILSNTYHLNLSPGPAIIKKAGGLHKFMGWNKPILTDSGGFQVFSLKDRKITEEGAQFKSPDGEQVVLTPEKSIEIQQCLGSDIMMAFDECIPHPATKQYTKKSIQRTHRWLDRCINSWSNPQQSLFGIIQGSSFEQLREECVQEVCSRDLPGYAIGGVSVGEGPELMEQVVSYTAPIMPKDRPRYVMGVGNPEDLLMIWEYGIDMSDCIIPTKFARGGTLFTNRGKLRIRHRKMRGDLYPVEPNCNCYTCKNFSRSYLKHLFDANEVLGAILTSTHNIAFYNHLARRARQAIIQDRFLDFKREFLSRYQQ
ncbi:MAG: tRNA guanosine(34) transglycosylase Tgt [Bdellovibrionales bacterium]|nr:tRNA guanosine(34) transglycosylase Tgt [Bdellovibrionales bacterium]MBT3526789.1 tRNA guanosine(34) transglycosylase Tgt [Bdellovibrionales bacterium]MBT7766914.1 tRNA guanosine(34) transglycosylase Tgt [Bdellovibrionales bacterium]